MPKRLNPKSFTGEFQLPSETITSIPEGATISELGDLFSVFGSDHNYNLSLILKFALKKIKGQFAVYRIYNYDRKEMRTFQEVSGTRKLCLNQEGSDCICHHAFVTEKRPHLFINDLSKTVYWDVDPDIKRHHLRAYIGCPVFISGNMIGAFAIFDKQPGDYDVHHVKLMVLLAGIISFAEQRRQVENDLAKANQALRDQIEQRGHATEELRSSSERLKEMNTAMRVLLDKRMDDHQRTEELIRLNLKELIDPYLTRLENSEMRGSQRQWVDLIRVNLDEVVASSTPEFASKYYMFSPNELQVVNLIRKGKTTKEMARLLNLSPRTVESYRDSIRKKLGLKNKKVNLRTYLSSI